MENYLLKLALICERFITLDDKLPIDSILELFVSQIKTLLDKHAPLCPLRWPLFSKV